MIWFWALVLVPVAFSGFLVLAMVLVDLVLGRRDRRIGELMDNLARRGEEILERERR